MKKWAFIGEKLKKNVFNQWDSDCIRLQKQCFNKPINSSLMLNVVNSEQSLLSNLSLGEIGTRFIYQGW